MTVAVTRTATIPNRPGGSSGRMRPSNSATGSAISVPRDRITAASTVFRPVISFNHSVALSPRCSLGAGGQRSSAAVDPVSEAVTDRAGDEQSGDRLLRRILAYEIAGSGALPIEVCRRL